MENSCGDLLQAFENLQVSNPSGIATTLADASSSSSSPNQLQQEENQAPVVVPRPLYAESMWSVQRLGETGNFACSNPQYETVSTFDFQSPSTNAVSFQANLFQHADILLLALDQQGSQYLQEKLFSGDSRIIDKTFLAVYMFPFQLMKHQYGRFVFGKLIESCNAEQLRMMTEKITSRLQDPFFLDASTEKFGSSSIKKLMKVLAKSPLIHHVMLSLTRLFNMLMINKFGASIILQCLESRYSRENEPIYQAALEHCLTLARHEQGCVYLNNFIDEMNGSRRKQILHLISMNADSLSSNPFGNYVVQHILKLENPELIDKICSALRGHCINLSMEKGGSFVLQKCLQYQTMVHHIVEEFLNSHRIFQVANDRYGNYVIQTALEATIKVNRIDLHRRLVMKLQQHLTPPRFGYGKHVYNFITGNKDLT